MLSLLTGLRKTTAATGPVFWPFAHQCVATSVEASSLEIGRTFRAKLDHSMATGLVGSLLGMGNPLLDVSAPVDQEFLDKYNVRLFELQLERILKLLQIDPNMC